MIENTVYSSRCYFIMAVVSFFMADVHFPRVTLTNNTVWFNFVIYNFILNSLSLKKKKTSHLCATQSICNRDPAEGFGQTSTFFQSFLMLQLGGSSSGKSLRLLQPFTLTSAIPDLLNLVR